MGLIDKIKSGINKGIGKVSKGTGHLTRQIDKGFKDFGNDLRDVGNEIEKISYKAGDGIKKATYITGDAFKDGGYIVGDVLKEAGYEIGDQLKKPEVQMALADAGFSAAMILAPEFAPELMMGQIATHAAIEMANNGGSLPTKALMEGGMAAATGLPARGSSDLSIQDRMKLVGDKAVDYAKTDGKKYLDRKVEETKFKLTEKSKETMEKIKTQLGFDPTEIKSTNDALLLLQKQIKKNKVLQAKLAKAQGMKTKAVEAKSDAKNLVNNIVNNVGDKNTLKKTVKSAAQKQVSNTLDNLVQKAKRRARRYQYSSDI